MTIVSAWENAGDQEEKIKDLESDLTWLRRDYAELKDEVYSFEKMRRLLESDLAAARQALARLEAGVRQVQALSR